jgi:hypothetical protein
MEWNIMVQAVSSASLFPVYVDDSCLSVAWEMEMAMARMAMAMAMAMGNGYG